MDDKTHNEDNYYRCVVCGTERHYMDTLTISGSRWCLRCLKEHAEVSTHKLARLRAELAQALAERDAWRRVAHAFRNELRDAVIDWKFETARGLSGDPLEHWHIFVSEWSCARRLKRGEDPNYGATHINKQSGQQAGE